MTSWVAGCLWASLHCTRDHRAPCSVQLQKDYPGPQRAESTLRGIPSPRPWRGHPELVSPNPGFPCLADNQEVTDCTLQDWDSFLNQTVGRYLNPNPYLYEPYRNYPNEHRQDNRYLSRDRPNFIGRSRFSFRTQRRFKNHLVGTIENLREKSCGKRESRGWRFGDRITLRDGQQGRMDQT